MSIRLERIGEELRGELARLLRDEVADPRVGLVTLTRVDVAPDLSTASVYWSRLAADEAPGADDASERAAADRESVEEVGRGLASAAGFLRRRLAAELSLRRTPELRFRHDPSIAAGAATLSLLRELADERDARDHGADDASEEDRRR